MIASLRGRVQSTNLNSLILDVSGVGYLVQVTPSLAMSVQVGQELDLVTSFIVREDSFTIFGFTSKEELRAFELLLSVSGVGPKLALSVIHQLGVDALGDAIEAQNDSAFKAVSGIGPKTAKLLVVTLSGKLTGNSNAKSSNSDADLVSALVGLGYQTKVSDEIVKKIRKENPEGSAEQILRLALQGLAR
ncbi:MAG: Holliday junction branch migration protein RuvA [Micrococcales bacterium]